MAESSAAARARAHYLDVVRLRGERDLLVEFVRRDLTGMSAAALVVGAITGTDPTRAPLDRGDLGRCEKAYAAAPPHLQAYMHTWIERWRAELAERNRGRAS